MTLQYITSLQILNAKACNLKCSYCYVNTDWMRRDNMVKIEQLKEILDWYLPRAVQGKPLFISFGGLEPSLEIKAITQALDYLRVTPQGKQHGVKISFHSNGTILLTPQWERLIKDNPGVFRLNVSCDGDPRVMLEQRGTARFEPQQFISAVGRYLDHLGASMTIGREELFSGKAKERLDYLFQVGFKVINIGLVGQDTYTDDKPQLEKALDQIGQWWFDKKTDGKEVWLDNIDRFEYKMGDLYFPRCHKGNDMVTIDANLDVFACGATANDPLGKDYFKQGSIRDVGYPIITHGHATGMLEITSQKYGCKTCEANKICNQALGFCGTNADVFMAPIEHACELYRTELRMYKKWTYKALKVFNYQRALRAYRKQEGLDTNTVPVYLKLLQPDSRELYKVLEPILDRVSYVEIPVGVEIYEEYKDKQLVFLQEGNEVFDALQQEMAFPYWYAEVNYLGNVYPCSVASKFSLINLFGRGSIAEWNSDLYRFFRQSMFAKAEDERFQICNQCRKCFKGKDSSRAFEKSVAGLEELNMGVMRYAGVR